MSRFINNNNGIMGLTLSQLGLMIATAILLAAVVSFLFFSDWQRNADLSSIATSVSNLVEGMDSQYFENTTRYQPPEKNYPYTVDLSTEYISVSAKGSWNNGLSIKHRFMVQPWPQNSTINQSWISGEALHEYLNQTYGHNGTRYDPIDQTNSTKVQTNLSDSRNNTRKTLAVHPLLLLTNKPVFLDKVIVYYDTDGNGSWEKESDEKQEFVIVYQFTE